jgi:hypothetical protein
MATLLNGLGLLLNMFGTVLWFFYGLATYTDTSGNTYLMLEQPDPMEAAAAKRSKRISQFGLLLLFLGFLAQFVALFFNPT